MKKQRLLRPVLLLVFAMMTEYTMAIDVSNVPGADANGRVGALMPYTRYDSEDAELGGDAVLRSSSGISMTDIAAQASGHSYVSLPSSGAYAEWTAVRSGNGVTMRFTLPDATSGTNGRSGSLDIYVDGERRNVIVNGETRSSISLSSYSMWQYFDKNIGGSHTDNASDTYIAGATACFAFDEVGFLVEGGIEQGQKVKIQSSGDNGLEYGIDFLEIEKVTRIEKPEGWVEAQGNLQEFLNNHQGQNIYLHPGVWTIGSKLYLPTNTRIMGAGIYYTTLHFTSAAQGGGGVVTAGGTTLSDVHLTSYLNSRYNQGANYKGLEGGPDGFNGYNLWIQHFECGAWFEVGNNIKIANCRLRDNLADGLNFCRGTSNSTAYNCSVRNNGDDGLAMWNHNWNCGDEYHNTFCYNTVEFDWRAGSIGVFGGVGHKIYNNLIVHSVYAAGIRVNTDFPGYAFQNTFQDPIAFTNNTVSCSGANPDIFGGQLPSVDIRNNYSSQAVDHEVKNVTFNNTKIYGSHWEDYRNTTGINFTYELLSAEPDYPPVDDSEEPLPVSNPLDGISGYDLKLEALAWQNAGGSSSLTEGDQVTFTVKVTNASQVDIPQKVLVAVNLDIDNNTTLSASTRDGLAANESRLFTFEWIATPGGHAVKATADPADKLPQESSESNNTREKHFNVVAGDGSPNEAYTPVSGGPDLQVTDIAYINLSKSNEKNGAIDVGDHIQFCAHVVNAGSADTQGNTKHGVQYQVDGKGWNEAPITWCDNIYDSQASHAFRDYPANGGGSSTGAGNGLNYWTATAGSHTVKAWLDNDALHEINHNNNDKTITLPTIPYGGVTYLPESQVDEPDPLFGFETLTINEKVGRSTLYYSSLNLRVPQGLKAYTIAVDAKGHINHTRTWAAGQTIPAGVAVVVEGAAGTYQLPVVTENAEVPTVENHLLGRDEGGYITTANYDAKFYKLALNAQEKNPGFYYGAANGAAFTMNGAHRAYLAVPTIMANGKASFLFVDVPTAIQSLEANSSAATWYDLQGRRLLSAPKRPGIYILNGRKRVVK